MDLWVPRAPGTYRLAPVKAQYRAPFRHRRAVLTCGCTLQVGGGKKQWVRLWCAKHDWQDVVRIIDTQADSADG